VKEASAHGYLQAVTGEKGQVVGRRGREYTAAFGFGYASSLN
jgi:hypothetical protein